MYFDEIPVENTGTSVNRLHLRLVRKQFAYTYDSEE
jgi:hypothetical protein